MLPDTDEDEDNITDDANANAGEEQKDDYYDDDDDDDSDLGTFEINTSSSHKINNSDTTTNNTNKNKAADVAARRKRQQQQQQEQATASQDPIVAMTERSNRLRKRAKQRAVIDSSDDKNGVTYKFIPDTTMLGNLPSFNGTIHPVKIGPQKRTGTYIAALLYKLPDSECTDTTKTILYSHGNATGKIKNHHKTTTTTLFFWGGGVLLQQ